MLSTFKGKAGFIIWRYLFRRDDPTPAPWTDEGKKLIEENGFTCIFPPGHEENMKAKAEKAAREKAEKAAKASKKKGGKKRKPDENDNEVASSSSSSATSEDAETSSTESSTSSSEPLSKKPKKVYSIPKNILSLMAEDTQNAKLWDAVKETPMSTKLDMTNAVEEHFVCSTCQELPDQPVTTACGHNVCLACLKRAFKSDYTNCPTCRADLKDDLREVNRKLYDVLLAVFPGYNGGR